MHTHLMDQISVENAGNKIFEINQLSFTLV